MLIALPFAEMPLLVKPRLTVPVWSRAPPLLMLIVPTPVPPAVPVVLKPPRLTAPEPARVKVPLTLMLPAPPPWGALICPPDQVAEPDTVRSPLRRTFPPAMFKADPPMVAPAAPTVKMLLPVLTLTEPLPEAV